jgi:hypothetical protein
MTVDLVVRLSTVDQQMTVYLVVRLSTVDQQMTVHLSMAMAVMEKEEMRTNTAYTRPIFFICCHILAIVLQQWETTRTFFIPFFVFIKNFNLECTHCLIFYLNF